MRAIHREDGELCGFVRAAEDGWHALTVFGGVLARSDDERDAESRVRDVGLSALAERWTMIDHATGEEEIVLIQEASPEGVTVALGYYSLPGVPTRRITRADLDTAAITLTRQ